MGIGEVFQKFSTGLTKTRESFLGKVQRLVLAKSTIDDELLNQIEEVLLSGDVGVSATSRLIKSMQDRVREHKYESARELTGLLRDEVARILRVNGMPDPAGTPIVSAPKPYVIMVVGVNGAGKTTTIGKLAYQFQQQGLKVIVGAADTFRAAANEQLEVWTKRAGAEVVRQAPGADPGSVVFDTLSSALAKKADVVLIDTAGRLHTKVNLMEELRKVRRVVEKKLPGAPHEVLLVLDAGTGQNGLHQVTQFEKAAGVTGIVVTKLDGTAKGGIVLAISHEQKIPVKYIGVGEGIDDLQPFDRRAFVDALFDKKVAQS